MTRRTKETAISQKTKQRVEERDHGLCIFCHKRGKGEAHFIPRSHGGLGVEENLLTVCRPCHDLMDNSTKRSEMLGAAETYLRARYPYWSREILIYEKGIMTKARVQSIREKYEEQRSFETLTVKNAEKTKLPDGFFFLREYANDGKDKGEYFGDL